MSPLSAVALLFLCATPAFTTQIRAERSQSSGFHHASSFSNGYQAVAASNNAPVVHTKASYKGCSSDTGCGSVTLENGKITESSGNPAALGLAHGESPENLDPSELHKKFALQAENINSGFGASLPVNGPLWWMGKDSPFKDSFEAYQKFVKENGLIPQFPSPCGTPNCPYGSSNEKNQISGSDGAISNSIDIASNPFLNGQFGTAAGFSSGSGSAGFSSGSGSAGFNSGAKNPFLNGNINLPGFGSTNVGGSSYTSTTSSGNNVMNLDANPFLNGALSGATAPGCAGGKPGSCGGTSGTVSFQQTGTFPTQSAGQQHVSTGFHHVQGQQNIQGSGGCNGGACNYPTQGQVTTGFGQTQTTGYQDQQQVVTGFGQTQPGCSGPFCGQDQQVIQPFPSVRPIPSKPPLQPIPNRPPVQPIPSNPSQPGLPHPPGATAGGFKNNDFGASGELTVTCSGQGYICVDKSLCFNGYVNDNGENILQARGGGRCKASTEVCCRLKPKDNTQTTAQGYIGNVQTGSTIHSGFQSTGSSGLLHVPGSPNENINTNHINTDYNNVQGSTTTGFGQTGYNQQSYNNFQGGTKPAVQVNPPFVSSGQSNVYKDSVSSQSQDQYYQRPTFGNLDKPGTPYLPPTEETPKPYVYPEPEKPFYPTSQRPTPPPYKPPAKSTTPYYVAPTTRPTVPYIPPASKTTPYVPAPTPTRPAPRPTTRPTYLPPKEHDESPSSSFGSQQIVPRPIPGEKEGGLLLEGVIEPPKRPKEVVPAPSQIPSACAAALKCTAIEFCTADGIISNTTVILTREQQEFRVPLTDCREPSTGVIGKCCRDPTYTDPWPTNQLGRWIPEAFGDTGAYRGDQYRPQPNANNNRPRVPDNRPINNNGFGSNPAGSINNPIYAANPNQVRPSGPQNTYQGSTRPINPAVQLQNPVNPGAVINNNQQPNLPRNPNYSTGQTITPGKQNYPVKGGGVNKGTFTTSNFGTPSIPSGNPNVPNSQVNTNNAYSTGELILSNFAQGKQQNVQTQANGKCGVRRTGTRPYGNKDLFEADFSEIPWQAMVLLQTNRSLLCGGVITSEDIVVTSASCVEGLEAKNVLIKGGEWKLGIDEEPLPFQIVQVAKIHRHPQYFSGSLQNDFAILVLSEKLRLAPNIEPICLPPSNQNADARLYGQSGYQCITSGWGKQVLQINIPNSIMHTMDMNLIPPQQCQAQITQNYPHLLDNYNANTCICGQPGIAGANVCKVDIGSALACTNGDGVYYMEGVYSWDSGCSSPNQLASFYKFDGSWYQSATSGQTNVQSQLYQGQQFIQGNNGAQFSAQGQAGRQQEQQASYSQYKQTVHKQGQSYAVNGQKAFEQAINGHVHANGAQCQCFEEGK